MDNPKKEDDEMQFGPQGKLGLGFWLFFGVFCYVIYEFFPWKSSVLKTERT